MGAEPARERIADAGHLLKVGLDAAEAIIAIPDQAGTGMITGGKSESVIPGNTGALYLITSAHAMVRKLEANVRRRVSGSEFTRGGSDANTHAALDALAAMEVAIPREYAEGIAADIERVADLAMALPGVEGVPQWVPIRLPDGSRPPPCPWCTTPNLRLNEPRALVACLYRPCPVMTIHGMRPCARVNRDDGGRVYWAWPDGTRQP
jgi:hypothetical protein